MQSYDDYVKRQREINGSVYIDGKEYVFLRSPQTVKMKEGRCETIAIYPSEATPNTQITESGLKTVNVKRYTLEWQVLNIDQQPTAKYDCDWENPLAITEHDFACIVDDLEEYERSTLYYIDNGLTLEIDDKLYLLKGTKKRHDNYYSMQVSCDTERTYWRGMIAWPQYELRWKIRKDYMPSAQCDWQHPDEIINLRKLVCRERNLWAILDDPNVYEDVKDYIWEKEFQIFRK